VVQPVPMSMMTVSVVDLEVQRLAAGRRSCRPARIRGDTDIPTRHAYTQFAAVHAANGVGTANPNWPTIHLCGFGSVVVSPSRFLADCS